MSIFQNEDLLERRVKLKNYVYFGDTDDGVWFEGGKESFILKGRGYYPIAERLISLLDNGHSISTIFKNSPEPLRPIFELIIKSLDKHKMLKLSTPLDEDTDNAIHIPKTETYKFLEDQIDTLDSDTEIQKILNTHITLIGNGYSYKAAVRGLISSGFRNLDFIHLDRGNNAIEVNEIFSPDIGDVKMRNLKNEAALKILKAKDFTADSLLLYISDADDLELIRTVQNIIVDKNLRGRVAGVFSNRPLISPEIYSGSLAVNDVAVWLANKPETQLSISTLMLSVMGCLVVQHMLLDHIDHLKSNRTGLAYIISPQLEVSEHAIIASTQRDFAKDLIIPFKYPNRFEMPEGRFLDDFENLMIDMDPWFDPLTGAFSKVSANDVQQIPFFLYPISVEDSGTSPLKRSKKEFSTLYGWGLEVSEAGVRALLKAVETWLLQIQNAPPNLTVSKNSIGLHERALAKAVVNHAQFKTDASLAKINLSEVLNTKIQLFSRLLHYNDFEDIVIIVRWSKSPRAFLFETYRNNKLIAKEYGLDFINTLIEMLGELGCQMQLDASDKKANSYKNKYTESLPSDLPYLNVDIISELLSPHDIDLSQFDLHQINGFNLPESIHAGYVDIGEVK